MVRAIFEICRIPVRLFDYAMKQGNCRSNTASEEEKSCRNIWFPFTTRALRLVQRIGRDDAQYRRAQQGNDGAGVSSSPALQSEAKAKSLRAQPNGRCSSRRTVSGNQGAHRGFWILEVADWTRHSHGPQGCGRLRTPVEVRRFFRCPLKMSNQLTRATRIHSAALVWLWDRAHSHAGRS